MYEFNIRNNVGQQSVNEIQLDHHHDVKLTICE